MTLTLTLTLTPVPNPPTPHLLSHVGQVGGAPAGAGDITDEHWETDEDGLLRYRDAVEMR